jgi:hypothetical protein
VKFPNYSTSKFTQKTQNSIFLRQNLYGGYLIGMSNFQIWNLQFCSFKSAVRFVLRRNLLNKTQVLTSLRRNLYRRYLRDVKFQNSEYGPKFKKKHPSDLLYDESYKTKF